ncbi:hypothetical protein NQ176_g7705 [Zarea fungicola]|uniref:Uncharacterized protein n=1 Tax=Zarea fungicola TaxID=93591 RepID=A0ACC1MXS5_9HYPO|nr:hypothetical protein NQ176_g7705 [Lecanicillium fungicola]
MDMQNGGRGHAQSELRFSRGGKEKEEEGGGGVGVGVKEEREREREREREEKEKEKEENEKKEKEEKKKEKEKKKKSKNADFESPRPSTELKPDEIDELLSSPADKPADVFSFWGAKKSKKGRPQLDRNTRPLFTPDYPNKLIPVGHEITSADSSYSSGRCH